jgi:hypothetical protein
VSVKADAIDSAVQTELLVDTGLGTDYGKKLGGDYNYNETTIQIFLKSVASRLAPKYLFAWTTIEPSDAVAKTVAELESLIAGCTKNGPGWF